MAIKKKPNELDLFVGARLKEARLHAGLTKVDVCKHIKVDPKHLYRLENSYNRASFEILITLSKLYKKSLYFFVPEKDESEEIKQESRIVRLFFKYLSKIKDERDRKIIYLLVKSIAEKN